MPIWCLLYVIEPEGFQHWLGVEDVMRAEARADAEAALANASEQANSVGRYHAGTGGAGRQAGAPRSPS